MEWRIGGSGACASHPPTSHHDRLIVRIWVEGRKEGWNYHTKTTSLENETIGRWRYFYSLIYAYFFFSSFLSITNIYIYIYIYNTSVILLFVIIFLGFYSVSFRLLNGWG